LGLAAGPTGGVLALEPNPILFKILSVNAGLNKDKLNIYPIPYAATEQDGTFFYNSSEATFNNGGISATRSKFHGSYELEEKIEGVNLENLLRTKYADRLKDLTCIKVDTEGFDVQILGTLVGVIEEFKPTVIFEVFKLLKKEERYELHDLFADRGYELFQFDDFDISKPIKKISRENMTNWRHFEVYAKYSEQN